MKMRAEAAFIMKDFDYITHIMYDSYCPAGCLHRNYVTFRLWISWLLSNERRQWLLILPSEVWSSIQYILQRLPYVRLQHFILFQVFYLGTTDRHSKYYLHPMSYGNVQQPTWANVTKSWGTWNDYKWPCSYIMC